MLNYDLKNTFKNDIIFDNHLITFLFKIKLIGIFISFNLSQSIMYHIYIYVNQLTIISKYKYNSKYLSIKSIIRLIESLVLSILEYGNIILIGA